MKTPPLYGPGKINDTWPPVQYGLFYQACGCVGIDAVSETQKTLPPFALLANTARVSTTKRRDTNSSEFAHELMRNPQRSPLSLSPGCVVLHLLSSFQFCLRPYSFCHTKF